MILYFSATGNSRYTALKIAGLIGDEAVNLFEKIRNGNTEAAFSEKPWVLVCPTYAWQIPHIAAEWIAKTELNGNKNFYTVMTCGGEIGNAGEYVKALCEKKGLRYCGCTGILMPDNYLVMFNSPETEKAKRIIEGSKDKITETAEYIKSGKNFPEPKISALDKLYSGVINKMFYKISVKAKPFYATDACIRCGRCETVCPLGNIKLKDGKPEWGNDCTHCMACICSCPKEAIEYGKKTQGKVRYRFPEDI